MSKRSFDFYGKSYKIISVTQKRLLKIQIFEKKQSFPLKKKLAYFLFVFPSIKKTSGNKLNRSTRVSHNHCVSYMIVSVGPKKLLKTRIFERECKLSSENRILAYFSFELSSMMKVEEKLIRGNKVI